MPIYEYYCSVCHGRFSHLARTIDADAPPCPRCGNPEVERLVTAANLAHGATHHRDELREEAAEVDRDDPQAMAQFLAESGRLDDATGLYGSRAYRELIHRRTEGATDADLADLVDDLTATVEASEATKMAGAMLFSDDLDARMQAEGPPEGHDHGDEGPASNDASRDDRKGGGPSLRRPPDKLGWA
ncbi:MAG: FmdB family zinc ribbon protein [Anaerolineae bacterium]